MKTLCLLLSTVTMLAFAQTARADAVGYVCKTGWVPAGGLPSFLQGTGAYGVVYSFVYSAPDCQGSQTGMAYFCTVGATNTKWCNVPGPMTEAQASALSLSFQHAGAAGQKVTLYTVSTSAPNAGIYAEFASP